jgi:hypothetical protein
LVDFYIRRLNNYSDIINNSQLAYLEYCFKKSGGLSQT